VDILLVARHPKLTAVTRLFDQAAVVLGEMDEQVERLRRQGHWLSVTP
jgi:hypothetical protein